MPDTVYTNNLLQTAYFGLMAKYGNSSIASTDPHQFKLKLFLTIFEYAPAWQGRLKIQEKLFNMDLSQEDFLKGTTAFYNHAENPDTAPSTASYQELGGINSQNTTQYKRGKLEGYAMLYDLIENDVSEEFFAKFQKLFIKVVMPQAPLWYGEIGRQDEPEEDFMEPNSSVYGNYRTNTFAQIYETFDDFKYDYEHIGIPTTI